MFQKNKLIIRFIFNFSFFSNLTLCTCDKESTDYT